MTVVTLNESPQPLEQFEKCRKELLGGKGLHSQRRHNMDALINEIAPQPVVARCETETAGAVESTVPPVGVGSPALRDKPLRCSGVAKL